MRRISLESLLRSVVVAALMLSFVPAAFAAASSEPRGAWGAREGADPCGSETLLEQALLRDPSLRAKLDQFAALAREAERTARASKGGGFATSAVPIYTIPVVVHIVYASPGDASDISDNQVLSQIDALNRDFKNLANHGSPAVDAQIQFCLATTLPAGSPVVWSTTPGITRTMDATHTITQYGNFASDSALKVIDYLPSDHYLNIWVIKLITGGNGGVVGYATFPAAVPATMDGIVMRYDIFGSNTTGWGNFNLLPSNADGKILAHEAGHYLSLYHTFHAGCGGNGDEVSDTTPEALENYGCPGAPVYSCTPSPDPVENFMDYTNDACRFAFTSGQAVRMQTAIATWRSSLVSASNLQLSGCSDSLYAIMSVSSTQLCAGGSAQFGSPVVGPTIHYAWSFPGGVPSSAATHNASASYPSPGLYTVTLTVTDTLLGHSSSTLAKLYVNACTPIVNACSRWVFSQGCAVDFSSGSPQPVLGTKNNGVEAGAVMSDAAGNLLFYSNADSVWGANNVVMPNGGGIFGGNSSHCGAIAVPYPGHANQYLLFTISQQENLAVPNPVRYSVIDMSLNGGMGDVVMGMKNIPVTLAGNPMSMMEGQTLIPHCNGVDWWHISHGASGLGSRVYVTPVTSAGIGAGIGYPIGLNVPSVSLGGIAPSSDGSMFAACSFKSKELGVYNFDRSTGVPTTRIAPAIMGADDDACFSPDGKLLYYNCRFAVGPQLYGVRQLDLATLQQHTLFTANNRGDLELGPDGLIYAGSPSSLRMHCINFPNVPNLLDANECGLNLNSVYLMAQMSSMGALPNTVFQCTPTVPAQFNFTVTNCTTVSFHAINCSTSYAWAFGDGQFATGQNVTHTYANPGTYTVVLTVLGAVPSTASKTLTLGGVPVTIAGPVSACTTPANYSVAGPNSYTYQWTISGGTPASAMGNNVDVSWTALGGAVIVTGTDPLTGCVSRDTLMVAPCGSCVKPPLLMVAWWPLDEPSGSTALELLAANDGSDINTPTHVAGQVLNARHFDGTTNFVRVKNDSRLNFGTGDLSIDAWVRTTSEASFVPIVDKRIVLPEPELGYALYLKNGRLAFRLGDGTGAPGTEFYSAATPFVADGQWHHVAATEQRSNAASGTQLYVDGAAVASFGGYGVTRNTTNGERLLIGARQPSATPTGFFAGDIDEVELFRRALLSSEVQGLYAAGQLGKCKEYCQVPATTLCKGQGFTTVNITLCNYSTVQQSYNLSGAGLPVGAGCSWVGPNSFVYLVQPPFVVPANSCITVPVKITRPIGMPVGATACYQVTMTNINTGAQRVARGTLFYSNVWCPLVAGPILHDVQIAHGHFIHFGITNTSDTGRQQVYRVRATPSTLDTSEPWALSLNGLPPGTPYEGTLSLAAGDSADVEVSAQFTEERAFRFYDVVLEIDADSNGDAEIQSSVLARFQDDVPPATVDVSLPGQPQRLDFAVVPNPLERSTVAQFALPAVAHVRMALYDLSGRRLRTIVDGMREPGVNRVAIDARGLAGGIYFLRLEVAGKSSTRRLVLLK